MSTTTATSAAATASTTEAATHQLYHYTPSTIVPIICAGIFGASAFFHLFQMIRKRTWFYTAFTVGSFMMTLGYAARYLSAKSPSKIPLYAAQSLFIILPPSLYAATMYMIFGRLVLFVNNPSASLIRPTRVTKIFVCGDVLAFMLQAGGGGMMSSGSGAALGQKVIIAGLLFQLLFFGFFLVIALTFRRRMGNSPFGNAIGSAGTKHSWQSLLLLLLIAAGLIIGRCLFRVVEFGMGMDGVLMSKEVFMYLGDTAPMLAVQVMFHGVHAGDVFTSEFVQTKGKGMGMESESYVPLNEMR
ncbi:RTA1 like protein-domain-containing protein [Halenospora varia]|nr:RTA1 like protein-domain-containing protein [Halenospora varia]